MCAEAQFSGKPVSLLLAGRHHELRTAGHIPQAVSSLTHRTGRLLRGLILAPVEPTLHGTLLMATSPMHLACLGHSTSDPEVVSPSTVNLQSARELDFVWQQEAKAVSAVSSFEPFVLSLPNKPHLSPEAQL